jgi:hypothetical protein
MQGICFPYDSSVNTLRRYEKSRKLISFYLTGRTEEKDENSQVRAYSCMGDKSFYI